MATLFEAYKTRLSVAESYFGKTHEGEKMDNNRWSNRISSAASVSDD